MKGMAKKTIQSQQLTWFSQSGDGIDYIIGPFRNIFGSHIKIVPHGDPEQIPEDLHNGFVFGSTLVKDSFSYLTIRENDHT